MNLEETIKKGCKENNITLKYLCQQIDMSEPNLYRNFKRNSMETKILVKIADVLKVPITYFFGGTEKQAGSAELEALALFKKYGIDGMLYNFMVDMLATVPNYKEELYKAWPKKYLEMMPDKYPEEKKKEVEEALTRREKEFFAILEKNKGYSYLKAAGIITDYEVYSIARELVRGKVVI